MYNSLMYRRQHFHSTYFKFYLFLFFITTPLLLLSRFFLLGVPSFMPHTSLSFKELLIYIYPPLTLGLTYGFTILAIFAMSTPFWIRMHRALFPKNPDDPNIACDRVWIVTPVIMVMSTVYSIVTFFATQLSFIQTIPYFFFQLAWSFIVGHGYKMYFIRITVPLKSILHIYSFEKEELNFYDRLQEICIIIAQIIMLITCLSQLFIAIHHYQTQHQLSDTNFLSILMKFFILLTIVIIFSYIILFQIQSSQNKAAEYLYKDVKFLSETGHLGIKHNFESKDMLGLLISEYNKFLLDLHSKVRLTNEVIDILDHEDHSLSHYGHQLITTLDSQEQNVFQMSINSRSTQKILSRLVEEITSQHQEIQKYQNEVSHLQEGITQISLLLQKIISTYQSIFECSNSALSLTNNNLEKSKQVRQQLLNVNQKIQETSRETVIINEVLALIKNISEQTDLLSMSAAIEAAHSNRSSKGFVQVANEIRNLANRSHKSVENISQRLSSITNMIDEAYVLASDSIMTAGLSLHFGESLNHAQKNLHLSLKELSTILNQTTPNLISQKEPMVQFHNLILEMGMSLEQFVDIIQKQNNYSRQMSSNFITTIQNFKENRKAMYSMVSAIERMVNSKNELKELSQNFNVPN